MVTNTAPMESTAQHRHPVRGRFNSWILRLLEGHVDRQLHAVRAELFGTLQGEVAEIGAGNGPTFRYLRNCTTVHAIEPNPYFHPRLRQAARAHGIEVVVHP